MKIRIKLDDFEELACGGGRFHAALACYLLTALPLPGFVAEHEGSELDAEDRGELADDLLLHVASSQGDSETLVLDVAADAAVEALLLATWIADEFDGGYVDGEDEPVASYTGVARDYWRWLCSHGLVNESQPGDVRRADSQLLGMDLEAGTWRYLSYEVRRGL